MKMLSTSRRVWSRLDERRALSLWPRNFAIWFGRFWLLADTRRFDRLQFHHLQFRRGPIGVLQVRRGGIDLLAHAQGRSLFRGSRIHARLTARQQQVGDLGADHLVGRVHRELDVSTA